MKTTHAPIRTAALALCLGAATALAAPPAPPPFLEQLSPHGDWRHADDLGWHWAPREAGLQPEWRPYVSGGHWHWNGETWQWASDYPWGAVVFHHGRWARLPDRGWRWFPGLESSPAWVHWVRAEGFWGWVPLPPTTEEFPAVSRRLEPRPDDFVFVPEGRLTERHLDPIVVAGTEPGSPPRTVAAPAAVQPPVWIEQPAPVVIHQQPVQVVPTYVHTPVVVREHVSIGPAVSWYWHHSICSSCRSSCGGRCSPRSRSAPSVVRPQPPSDPRGRTRLEPVRTPAPASRPHHVQVDTRTNVRTAPIQSGTPAAPSIHRPAPPPATTGSRRAQGVRDFLNSR